MQTMFIGGFGAAGHSYWMGQQATPIAPLTPTPRVQRTDAGAPGAPPVHAAPGEAPYTIPIIGAQVPAKILGLPAQTVVIGGAVVLGGIILMKVL